MHCCVANYEGKLFWRNVLLDSPITVNYCGSLQIVASLKVGPEDDELKSKKHKIINKIMWLIGTSRNAILVIVCGAIGYVFQSSAATPFKLIGDIPPGMPSVEIPPFTLNANQTSSGREESFSEVVSSLGSGLIVVPLIALMENIAICKAFCRY